MTDKKEIKKNPNPLVIKGIFFVTAVYEDKQYFVSNGLSFIRFAKEGENIKKGDYVSVHGTVYQRKDAANPIITGESIVEKLEGKALEDFKAKTAKAFEGAKKSETKKAAPKKAETKSDSKKMPWE